MPGSVELSVVVPIHNEGNTVPELVNRCLAAAERTSRTFELVIIDDASDDTTSSALEAFSETPGIVVRRLDRKLGQFGATQQGLAAAQGAFVIVLDGDLQDPPEIIVDLVRALAGSDPGTGVVFGVKASRSESLWFRVLRAMYDGLLRLGPGPGIPAGAGSFCAMRQTVAAKIASVQARDVNIAVVASQVCNKWLTVEYSKAARREGVSKVGLLGLLREGLASAAISGALSRLFAVLGVVLGSGGMFLSWGATPNSLKDVAGSAFMAVAGLALLFSGLMGWERIGFIKDVRFDIREGSGFKRWVWWLHPGLWLPILAPIMMAIIRPSHGSLGLNLVAASLVYILAIRLAWIDKSMRKVIACALLVISAVLFVGVFLLSPGIVPISWITILHEGRSASNIMQITGVGAHAGWNFHGLAGFFSPSSVGAPLRDLVYFNIILGIINAIMFISLAWLVVSNHVIMASICVAFIFNRIYIMTATSELPSMLICTYFLVSVLAAWTIECFDSWDRDAAIALFGIVSVLVVGARAEEGIIWIPALLVILLRRVCGKNWLDLKLEKFMAIATKVLEDPKYLIIFLICIVALTFIEDTAGGVGGCALCLGNIFEAPGYVTAVLPFGVVCLVFLGFWSTMKQAVRFLLLPFTTILILHLYMTTGTFGAPYEHFRYITKTVPILLVLALFGWRGFENYISNMKSRTIYQTIATLVVLWSFLSPQHIAFYLFKGPEGWSWIPERNSQIEVRTLLSYMDQYPHCIFIAKVLKSSNVGGEQGHNYLLFDGKMDTDIKIVSSDGTNLKSLVSQFHNAKSCAFFYRSLDCNRSGEDDCTEELRGYIPIHEKTFNSAPYISDEEWGPTNPVITLGLYYSR